MSRSIRDSRGTTTEFKSGRDRILDLPEPLISHILSLMPTKDAVRTSVLSRDWEFKWTSLHHADIDDKVSDRQKNQPSFTRKDATAIVVSFVERLLQLSHDIRSFCLRLDIEYYHPDHISAWICDISTRNLESLIVESNQDRVILPRNLLRNSSLKNLEMKFNRVFSILRVPSRISFPNLKNLNLYQVWITNDMFCSDTLTLSFPVLETFEINQCHLSTVKMVELHAPQLTSFRRTFPEYAPSSGIVNYSIIINSASLVEFKFSGSVPEKFVLMGQQVVCATLSYNKGTYVPEEIGIQARVLVNRFSNLKELEVSSFLTQAFEESTGGVSFPVFHHLERLVVSRSPNGLYVKGLLELLYKTPFLKFLKIDGYPSDYDYNVVEHVPLCFEDHLEEIKYVHFFAESRELSLLEFMLENVGALKKFHVIWHQHPNKFQDPDEIPEPYLSAFSAYRTKLRFLVSEEDT